jgi:hypothetical protein
VASSALLLRQGSLELTPYHDVRGVVASLLFSIMSVLGGLALAANDKYFGATKQQRVRGHNTTYHRKVFHIMDLGVTCLSLFRWCG